MNSRTTCKYYDACSAPICPMLLDEQNSEAIWYPDEEICRKKKEIPDWVKRQQKIAKRANPENHDFYFRIEMLKVPFRVTGRVKGLNPDAPLEKESQQLTVWFQKHKGSKPRKLTADHREKLKNAAVKARRAKQQKQSLTTSSNPEGIMPSQPTIMEDLSMTNKTITSIGQETC